jgi:hypothetical protein
MGNKKQSNLCIIKYIFFVGILSISIQRIHSMEDVPSPGSGSELAVVKVVLGVASNKAKALAHPAPPPQCDPSV